MRDKMYYIALILLFLGRSVWVDVESRVISVDNDIRGHYWRDYENEMPADAFPAGKDSKNNVIYIAQVLSGEFLIPGQINQAEKKVYFDNWHAEHTATENVKILCTRYPEQYKWIKTTNEEFDNLDQKHLILGGYQPSYITYIGRLTSEEETSVGKVMIGNGVKELHITKNGKAISYNSFEVLSYDQGTPISSRNMYSVIETSTTAEDDPSDQSELECAKHKHIININIS